MRPLAEVRILHFRHELATPVPTTMGPLTHRPALLVRLEDIDGAVGWGETWCNFPPGGDLYRAGLAAQVAAAALEGIETAASPFRHVQSRLHRLSIQAGEPGPIAQIACGFDIALADLAARRAGLSLAKHLGGTRRALPAYASGISPERAGDQIDRMRGLGYRTFKQRLGFGPDHAIPEAEATAQGLAADERLMLDANQAWDLDQARTHCARLERLNPVWMEEPLPADATPSDWRSLAGATAIPLAAGENLTGDAGFDRAAAGEYGLRFLQPDICKWGGISVVARIARKAQTAGLTYCPHFLGGGVGLLASAQLLAAVGGDGWLEVDASENPLLEVFSAGAMTLRDGFFHLPDGEGLGPEPDTEAVADLLVSQKEVRL